MGLHGLGFRVIVKGVLGEVSTRTIDTAAPAISLVLVATYNDLRSPSNPSRPSYLLLTSNGSENWWVYTMTLELIGDTGNAFNPNPLNPTPLKLGPSPGPRTEDGAERSQ